MDLIWIHFVIVSVWFHIGADVYIGSILAVWLKQYIIFIFFKVFTLCNHQVGLLLLLECFFSN